MTEATQATFAELEYRAKKRKTRRERFLERMDGLVPWKERAAAAGHIRCRRCCGCIARSCFTT